MLSAAFTACPPDLADLEVQEQPEAPIGENVLSRVRYRAVLAYDGAAYQGFQRQSDGKPSVQAEVERALASVIGQPVRIIGAARTDTGVHAAGQVIAFDVPWRHDEWALLRAVNASLPDDIALQQVSRAERGFHPRFDATSRVYCYQVYAAAVRNPLYARTAWQIRAALDLDAMNAAAAVLLGEHDFATFGAPTQGDNTTRQVFKSAWHAEQLANNERLLHFDIAASGFLHHMVRVLVGALVDVGAAKWSLTEFADALNAADRSRARQMAPPHGLTLIEVTYNSGGSRTRLTDNVKNVENGDISE